MIKKIEFILQYILNPRTVGAVLPSSSRLAKKMVENIDFSKVKCIVEYGPGTGVFTEELIRRRNKNTIFFIIEYNEKFYKLLKDRYKNEKNIFIVNDSAENIDKYLKINNIEDVDYVVSGLPFASLPKEVSINILKETKKLLDNGGEFITFQYTLFKKDFINKYFKDICIKREIKNIPPAYVLSCKN